MSVLLHAPEVAPIVAVLEAVGEQRGPAVVHGVAPGLVVDDPAGWLPAEHLASGEALPVLLDAAHDRWGASPAAAAALAWKSYAYWLTLPAVVGYAAARRIPDLSAGNVLVRVHGAPPFVEIGLRAPAVAVAPGDPLAGTAHVTVTRDLPGYLRRTLVDDHLAAVLDGLHRQVRIGRRTLLGSLASGVAYGLVRSADALPAPVAPAARTLLSALGVDHLVEITPDLRVQRRTCCLAFTLPEPKICAGCCIPS
jgi:ferric iron reductase protein FhuF